MNPNDALNHLRNYLRVRSIELALAGKISGVGEDSIEAAASAVLTGSGALAAQIWADLGTLAGEGRPIVEGLVANAVNRSIQKGVQKGGDLVQKGVQKGGEVVAGFISDLFGKPSKRNQAEAGKKIMAAAKNLGRQRGSK